MQKPGNLSTPGIFHYRVEPGCLGRLFAVPAAEQHGIESYEANTLDILDPPVRPEIRSPARQPLVGDRLTGVSGVADVVIAGHRAKAHAEQAHQLSCVSQIVLYICAV